MKLLKTLLFGIFAICANVAPPKTMDEEMGMPDMPAKESLKELSDKLDARVADATYGARAINALNLDARAYYTKTKLELELELESEKPINHSNFEDIGLTSEDLKVVKNYGAS